MELVKLLGADIYRDGGSYSAEFLTNDGLVYSIFLQRSKMPDEEGLHHKFLYEYFGYDLPENCKPILTGSVQEQELLERLNNFVSKEKSQTESENYHFQRLAELIKYIPLREPCFNWEDK